ncbi:Variant-specific surface protein [Giardia duodenalis assemblage B]|uniref:Variant-specific surface protein n=1 Tax=Giardia duodenalis assemblage B TaxID=1394984 RepID=A0A132NM70_GIAIN|nr:Variant-specific surface protein [Giardia intestinalis assemblage B]
MMLHITHSGVLRDAWGDRGEGSVRCYGCTGGCRRWLWGGELLYTRAKLGCSMQCV